MHLEGHPLFKELPTPFSFCILEFDSDGVEYSTHLISMCPNGYIITSPRKLAHGTLISLRMCIPALKLTGIYWENRLTARVVEKHLVHGGATAYRVEVDGPLPS